MEKWDVEQIEELKNLYIETDIPSDSLIKDKTALANFTKRLNLKFGNNNNFTEEEIADKLLSLRKSANLPRIRD